MAKTPKSRWLSARPPITIGGAVDPHAAIQHAYRAIAWLYDAVDELGAKISEGPAPEEPPITSIESQVYIDGGKAELRAYRDAREKVLLKIVAELDGKEWNADTVDAIAEILRADGYMVRDSEGDYGND
jgi:hypothetical protein